MNRVAKHTLRFAAVLAVIVLAVVLLVSPVATWLVNRYGEQWTGRQIEVESVSVNVFAGTVKARNLNVSESVPDDGRFIHVGRLYADLRMTALLQKTIKLDSLYFGHFFVRIDQDSDRFNFTDLIERFASSDTIQDETESAADTTKSGWGVILSHIKFENSAVHYRDIPLSARFDLKDISLYIPEINLSTMRTMMGLDFEFEEGGTFGTQLVYDDATHNYDLQLWVNQVPLTYGLPYMRQYLYADSVQGTISTELRILGNTDHLIQLDLSGKVNGHDWALYSNDSLPIIQFDSVEVALRGINLSNKELKMGNLALSGLQTSYTLFDDSTTNWSRIVLPDDDEWVAADSSDLGNMPEEELMEAEIDVEAFPEDSIPWHLVVDRMAISHVALNYADSTMSPAFRYGVSDLTVDVRNFDTDKINTANVLARLQQKGALKLKWRGKVRDMLNQYVSLSVSNVALSDFSPFTLFYTGFPLNGGTLSVNSEVTISNGQLQGDNSLELFHPQAGVKDKERKPVYNIPLKTVLYLVTDSKGRMQMDLPVSGNVEAPNFSYKKLVVKTLMNALGRIAASPFNAMAKSLRARQNDLPDVMEVDLTQKELNARQYAFLDALAQMWREHDRLNIGLSLQSDIETEKQTWAKRQLQMAWYRRQHPDITEEDLQYMNLSVIYDQNINDKAVKKYVEQEVALLGHKKIKNYSQAIWTLYGTEAMQAMQRAQQNMHQMVNDYLVRVLSVPENKLSVTTDENADAGKTAYHVVMLIPDDETAEDGLADE